MKNKILTRLIIYFASTFLVYSLVIGIVFSLFFSRYNLDVHKNELEKRAVNVAHTIAEMLDGGTGGEVRRGTGYGAYLRFIEDISMNEAWVVDHNLQPILYGHDEHEFNIAILSKELPRWASESVLEAIEKKALVSDSLILDAPTVMAAMPIVLHDGKVLGAVLLQSHVIDANAATSDGIVILIFSMGAAVIISIVIAAILSKRFTNPLRKMKTTAIQISGGDYSVKTGVKQPDEIGELAAIIDDMAGRLEVSSQEQIRFDNMRRDFIANISHELRTPVTVIRGSLEAICDGVVDDEGKIAQYHAQMLSESIFLERLVSDLLDLARLQNPDFKIEFHDVDLKNIIEDVIRGMSRLSESKDIKLEFICNGDVFLTTGDYGRLRQMMIIVLDNAIKFSPDGKTVGIRLLEIDSEINVVVSDEGCGIPPDEMPYIFERFYKQRSEENKTGSGLGLAIAKQISDRHGVTINVESNQGKGTTITFRFQREVK